MMTSGVNANYSHSLLLGPSAATENCTAKFPGTPAISSWNPILSQLFSTFAV